MTKDNSGPAFPVKGYAMDASGAYCGEVVMGEGITKREWFAGMALQGLIMECATNHKNIHIPTVAEDAYRIADEMIERYID